MNADILIVDDEADIRNLIRGLLEDEGYSVREAAGSVQAYEALAQKTPAVVVLDIWLQGSPEDGLQILKSIVRDNPFLPVLMISGHGTIETAVSAIRDGAYDFIEKPFKSDRLLLMIRRAIENSKLKRENAALKRQTFARPSALIGATSQILNVQQIIDRVAPTNSRILISGEPGTGKDIVARQIHAKSSRAEEAFFVMNCATMRPENFEAELFGTEAGTKESTGKTGLLEQASGGTLFLDEIADMPLETQGKMVRVLQEQKFTRVGGSRFIEVDVRIIASSNRNLPEMMEKNTFRQDLYYRLNVVPIQMPSLRERSADVPALADYFLKLFLEQAGYASRNFDESSLTMLREYHWPGNIRQLRNTVEWVVIMHGTANTNVFTVKHLPTEFQNSQGVAVKLVRLNDKEHSGEGLHLELPLREAREEFEREYLLSQVERFDGNISRTAQFIGMERSALHRKLKGLQVGHSKDEGAGPADMTDEDDKRMAS